MKSKKNTVLTTGIVLTLAVAGTIGAAASANAASRNDESPGDSSIQIMTAEQLREAISRTVLSFESLEYPSSEAQKFATARLGALELDGDMAWEAGIEENIVLDNWECSWLQHAEGAHARGDLREMSRAAQMIKTRAEIPGQRELRFPDVDRYHELVIDPLAKGDWGPVSGEFRSSCSDYLEIGEIQ